MKYAVLALFLAASLHGQVPSPTAGGYGDVPPGSPQAMRALRVARACLDGRVLYAVKVEKASTQVVAGLNTRLLCQVRERVAKGRREIWRWEFVVFSGLDGRNRLQSAMRLDRVAPKAP